MQTTTLILIILLIIITLLNVILIITKKTSIQSDDLKYFSQKIEEENIKAENRMREEFALSRRENKEEAQSNREELAKSFTMFDATLTKNINELTNRQKNQFEMFTNQLKEFMQIFTQNVKDFNDLQKQKFNELILRQENLKKETEDKLKEIRETVEGKLKHIQEDNNKRLEEMRVIVDEKLQETVEKRFNESFNLISERLEQVHKGLGEMQSLASGVGDLKKVLSNVKTRGNLGEIQLGAILEEILSSEQYEQNAAVKDGSQERVEYAVKLPGKDSNNRSLLLPIDSKFPIEDYQRLQDAYENIADLNPKDVELISKEFEKAVKNNAKTIRDKYINPPITTDFAIMFVPTEGLYAEILRRPGLFESLQRDFKITIVGPTNLVAFLSSLQMGFKTLAIEKRSSEVWEVLGAVKTEFGLFGNVLDKTKKKLQEASNVIDQAGIRTRAIERKLRSVQELPADQTQVILSDSVEIEQDNVIEAEIDEEN